MLSSPTMRTFWYLLLTDLKVFRKSWFDQIINMMIWTSTITIVFTYLMPSFGLSTGYSLFMIGGLCASGSLFNIFPSVMALVNDFEGDRIVAYYLTLPISGRLVFIRSIVYYAISGMAMSWIVFPLCKVLAWHQFDLTNFSLLKYLLIFVVSNFFYGAFTLFLATMVPDVTKIGLVWMRILYPLWFLGGFQFSWTVLYNNAPIFAYINLCNPFVYIMEGTRAAISGQEGYISFWICIAVLIVATVLVSALGLYRIKRRLDFV